MNGGLRTERVRDATRPTREAIARSIERILANHCRDRSGDPAVLAESTTMLTAYIAARLGPRER